MDAFREVLAADAAEKCLLAVPEPLVADAVPLVESALAEGTDIDLEVQVVDGAMLTSVTDHGIGIPRDEIPQLFERFHRARNVSSRYYGGLGLGLYIARAIIEAHNGSISVQSGEGQGSTFTMSLPVA